MKFILTFTTNNKIEFHMASDLGFPRSGDVPIASKRLYKRLGAYGLWAGKGLHPTTPDVTLGLLLVSFEWQPSFNLLLRQARGFNDKSLLLIFYLPGKSEDFDIDLLFYLFGHENWKYFFKLSMSTVKQCHHCRQRLSNDVPRSNIIRWILVFYVQFSRVCTYVSLYNSLSINRMRPKNRDPLIVKMGVAR